MNDHETEKSPLIGQSRSNAGLGGIYTEEKLSERGSFVTEYIYCDKCFAAAKDVLLQNAKHLRGVVVPMWGQAAGELPIIAGKIGGLYAGEELDTVEFEIVPELAKVLCHPMRIAVLAESGERIFVVTPNEKDNSAAL